MWRHAPLYGLVVLAACAAPAAFPSGPPAATSPTPVLAFPQAPPPPDVQADDAGAAPSRAAWARGANDLVRSELHRRARVCLAPTLNEEPDYMWRVYVAVSVAASGAVTETRVIDCVE